MSSGAFLRVIRGQQHGCHCALLDTSWSHLSVLVIPARPIGVCAKTYNKQHIVHLLLGNALVSGSKHFSTWISVESILNTAIKTPSAFLNTKDFGFDMSIKKFSILLCQYLCDHVGVIFMYACACVLFQKPLPWNLNTPISVFSTLWGTKARQACIIIVIPPVQGQSSS